MASSTGSPASRRAFAKGLVASLPDGMAALKAEQELQELAATTAGELYKQLTNPGLDLKLRVELGQAVAEKLGVQPETAALYAVLIENDELGSLSQLPRAVARQREARFGLLVVEVRSARALTDTQKNELTAAFARKTGRQVVLRESLDATLVAGAVATLGSEIYDSSVTGLLKSLENSVASA